MKAASRWLINALLMGAQVAVTAAGQDPTGGADGGGETSTTDAPRRVPRPFRDALSEPDEAPLAESVDAVVERFIRERTPCGLAGSSVPCFPTDVERESEELSVEDDLREGPGDELPVPPSSPTAGEMIQYGANPHPVAANVGGGTDVPCKAKQLFKKLTGKARTYYVYRVWDATGVRGALREEPLDADRFAGTPGFHYELVGRFGDECQALKAYQKIGHDERVKPSEPPTDDGLEVTPAP